MVNSHPVSSAFIRLAATMALAIVVITTPNVTYAALSFSSGSLGNLYNSTVGTKFIGSNRVQYLNISLLANGTSQFIINFYNRTSTSTFRKYTYQSVGSWSHLVSTKETLSCSLLFEANTSTFGFLQFFSDVESLKMYANISLDSLRGFLPAASSSADQNVIASNFVLGAGCYIGQLFGTIYSILNSGNVLSPVTVPPNWAIQANTQSFVYAISNNMLYRYNKALNQYDQIFSFANFSQYFLFEYQGRILVSASTNISNSTTAGVTTFRVNQSIYLLVDGSGSPNVLFQASLEGFSNLTYIKVFAAPKLTKFAYEYTPIGSSSAVIVVKSINYFNNKVVDLAWRDYAGFIQTRAAATYAEICFDDNFLAIRNGTPKAKNAYLIAVEEAYQYVNNQIIYFNRRSLSSSLSIWFKIAVDSSNSDSQLTTFNFYTYATYYYVERVYFYSYYATKKIIPTTQTFIRFTNSYSKSTNLDQLCWSSSPSTSPNIILTAVCCNLSSPSNITSFTTNFTATSVSTKAVSMPDEIKCRIIVINRNSTNFYSLAEYIAANNSISITYSLDSALASLTATVTITSLPMMLSPNCDRFNVGSNPKYVYHKVNNAFQSANSSGLFLANFTDQNLTYAVYGSTVWKYDTAQTQYVSYYNLSTLYPVVDFKAYQNRVIVVASNYTNSAAGTQVLAFIDQNGNLTQFFNATFILEKYVSVKISTRITKVAVIGIIASVPLVKLYHLDFSKRQSTSIYLPLTNIASFTYFTFNLFDQYFHVRKDKNDYLGGREENVFYFQNDVKPKLVFSSGFAGLNGFTSYMRSTIIVKNSRVYLATEFADTMVGQTYVNLAQLNINQTMPSTYLNTAVNSFYSGGVVKLCPPGCNECSNQVCTSCVNFRFVLDSNAGLCRLCPGGFSSCDQNFNYVNSGCIVGFFANSKGVCVACNSQCISCTNSTVCTQCFPGYYVNSTTNKCESCPRNCLQCASASSCTLCRRGFVVTSNATCRGCSLSCSSCLADNITQCTACAVGLELQGYQCVQCPANCQVCNQGQCRKCAPGYTLNNGTCSLNCMLPCATCAQGQPTTCLSCFGSSILNGSTCVFDISCNATADCTDCGNIYGLFLFEFYCIPCNSIVSIPNCIQCNQFNQYQCVICEDGYFVGSTGNCEKCLSTCSTCNNNATCTSCVNSSYTLTLNQTYGPCIACQSPCETCSGDPTYCLTCVSGYTKKFWKCQNNSFVGFSLTLSGAGIDTTQVLASIDIITASLLTSIAEDPANIDVITFTTIVSGSVIVSGSIAPTSGDTSAASSALSAGLSNGDIAGFTVTASSITLEGSSNNSSRGLTTENIVGLLIGTLCFLVIILILIVCMCKQKKKSRRVMEQFPQRYWNKFSIFDTAAVRQQPSRQMIVVEEISPRRRRRRQ